MVLLLLKELTVVKPLFLCCSFPLSSSILILGLRVSSGSREMKLAALPPPGSTKDKKHFCS